MLTAEKLVKSIGSKRIVENISLRVGQGEIVGLLGPNGAGKSTTFKLLTGILHPNSGKVTLNGVDVTHMPFHRRALHGLAYLPQASFLPRTLTVQATLALVMETRPLSRASRKARIDELLAQFDLASVRDKRTGMLSGGQRRRCEIAVCVACAPVVALFDEPFAGVDPLNVGTVAALLRQLAATGMSVLITDHSAVDMLRLVDRAYVVEAGGILAQGTPAELVNNEDVQRAYLGRGIVL